MQFSDYQNQASSEKIVLATLDASRRLMGWTLETGSVYSIPFTQSVIVSVEMSGEGYAAAESTDLLAGEYFLDVEAQRLFIRCTDDSNPNGKLIAVTFRLFFANVPVTLPHDLADGFEVFWEPIIKSTSSFGVEIDTISQSSEAIEGSGSLVFTNDQEFWPASFDKFVFENQPCRIYSYTRDLEASQARLIFAGYVEKKAYTQSSITFSLKDLFSDLRNPVQLETIETLGQRHSPNLARAYQRMILGRAFGHVAVNLDEVLDGFTIPGTVSIAFNSVVLTGIGTSFLRDLTRDDQIVFNDQTFTIATVTSDTSATVSEPYTGSNVSGVSLTVKPERERRFNNRVFNVAGHTLHEPTRLTLNSSDVLNVYISSTKDLFPGDTVYVGELGSGESAIIDRVVSDKIIRLKTSLAVAPPKGVKVTRPAIQNVRLDDLLLVYYRDYTFDAETGILTLRNTAEANAQLPRRLANNLSFTTGSRNVTGAGIDKFLAPGDLVSTVGNGDYFEVASIESATALTLRTPATFTTNAAGQYKNFIAEKQTVVSCDIYGRTFDGTKNGDLIRKGPDLVRVLLQDMGLADSVVDLAFDQATIAAPHDIGLVVPAAAGQTQATTYREVINSINKSINGALVQTDDFRLSYIAIQPSALAASLRLREEDILAFSTDATGENLIKTSVVQYRPREYNFLLEESSNEVSDHVSETAEFVVKTAREKVFVSKLVEQVDAERLAARWSIILEQSSGLIRVTTKLQGAALQVGDVIDIEHRKLFVRLGGTDKRRLALVQKVTKNGFKVEIEAVDLSNLFNRVAMITASSSPYETANDEERLYSGYITDVFGMINNDPETFGFNIIF